MNNKSLFVPGTIVLTDYRDFDGQVRQGVFCILYDEALDPNTDHKFNVVAVKVTTSQKQLGVYSVPLNYDDKNNFLKELSYAMCSKIHVISKNSIRCSLGRLEKDTYLHVYKTYKRFQNEMDKELISYI